jgi:hypothetical protein
MKLLALDGDRKLQAKDEGSGYLLRASKKTPLNVVAIVGKPWSLSLSLSFCHSSQPSLYRFSIGAARQGKSSLMNRLSRDQIKFRVSDSSDPCTQGVNLGDKILKLDDLREPCDSAASPGVTLPDVAFVDVEGQGDQGLGYDTLLACPVLLTAQTVIFNWAGGLQKSNLLTLLATMTKAAKSVGDESTEQKKFGHLIIVFRDWTFKGTASQVEKQVLDQEAESKKRSGEGGGELDDVAGRNDIRKQLVAAFTSISVFLLPSALTHKTEFNTELGKLRSKICDQLLTPNLLGGEPLTGPKIVQVMRNSIEQLNEGKVVLPISVFENFVRRKVEDVVAKAKEELLPKAAEAKAEVLKACGEMLTPKGPSKEGGQSFSGIFELKEERLKHLLEAITAKVTQNFKLQVRSAFLLTCLLPSLILHMHAPSFAELLSGGRGDKRTGQDS